MDKSGFFKRISYYIMAFFYYLSYMIPINPVKILLVMTHDDSDEGNVGSTYLYFQKRNPELIFKIVRREDYAFEKNKNLLKKIYQMFLLVPYHTATSRIIFMDNVFLPFSAIKIKKDTDLVQLWHGTGSIKKFGLELNQDSIKAGQFFSGRVHQRTRSDDGLLHIFCHGFKTLRVCRRVDAGQQGADVSRDGSELGFGHDRVDGGEGQHGLVRDALEVDGLDLHGDLVDFPEQLLDVRGSGGDDRIFRGEVEPRGKIVRLRSSFVYFHEHGPGDADVGDGCYAVHKTVLVISVLVVDEDDDLDEVIVGGDADGLDTAHGHAPVLDRRVYPEPLHGLVEIGHEELSLAQKGGHAQPDDCQGGQGQTGGHEQSHGKIDASGSHYFSISGCLLKNWRT